jgi:hypothetical protein
MLIPEIYERYGKEEVIRYANELLILWEKRAEQCQNYLKINRLEWKRQLEARKEIEEREFEEKKQRIDERYKNLSRYCQKIVNEIRPVINNQDYFLLSVEAQNNSAWKWSKDFDGSACNVE